MRSRWRLVALATVWAVVATACTSGDATTTTAPYEVATTSSSSAATPGTTVAAGSATASPPPPPQGPVLTEVAVDPAVAMPGESVTVTSPIEGRLELVGAGGVVAETELAGEAATLPLPTDTADGEYLLVVRSETRQLGLGAVRISSEPGIWASADRAVASDDELIRVRVGALGLSPDTPVMVGLGEGWEAELSWDDEDDSEDLSDDFSDDFSGPVGTLTATAEGLLIDAGLGDTTLLSELTGRDLFLAGTNADAIQLVVFGDELLFSDVLSLTRCNDPATVVGSIGGPGGVRLVAASGDLDSVAVATADGSFSVKLAAGPHLLTGWLDGEQPAPIAPIPLDVPCGGTVRVGEAPAEPPPTEQVPPIVVEEAFAVAQPPCRTLVVGEIVGPDGAIVPGLTQAVAGTLRATLPRAEVVVLSDIEALVDLAFEGLWSIRPGALVQLGGIGGRFGGSPYVSGTRHEIGGTLASYPGSNGDLAVSRPLADSTAEWVAGFAGDVASSALCIDAAPLHLAAGESAQWPVTVTDLAGDHADGAVVEVTGAESGEVAPSAATVAAAPAAFTYSAGPGTTYEGLTVYASMGNAGPSASATFSAGSGFTYVLVGSRRIGTADGEGILPLFGDLGFDLWACSPRPGGPYSGWFVVYDAGFFAISTAMTGLIGGLLEVVGAAPAGGATPPVPQDVLRDFLETWPSYVGDFGLEERGLWTAWLFGAPNIAVADYGSSIRGAIETLIENQIVPLSLEPHRGRIDNALFQGGEITLLASSEGSLVGTLNPATGLVGVRADGTWIMTTALLPFAEAPPNCTFAEDGEGG